MATQTRVRGICQNCIHASTCTYPERGPEPCMSCEEFYAQETPLSSRAQIGWLPSISPDCDQKLPGLCSDCQLRSTCVLHKPEGGVWFCEEYR